MVFMYFQQYFQEIENNTEFLQRLSVLSWPLQHSNSNFFHFRWNSLRAGHVSIRAQEKTSSHFFITKNTCHAHSRPFQAKHAQKMSGKKLP